MAVLRGLLALLCVVSSAESQSFFKAQSSQRVALASCRLPGVDGEARCGSYEVIDRIPQTPFRISTTQSRSSPAMSNTDETQLRQLESRFTDTWLKRQGHWQAVARHYSRVPVERKAIKLDAKIYDAYAGEYELAPGLALGVFKEGESLFGQAAGQPKFELHPESEVIFFLKEPPALFLFIRNDKGQVAQMLYIQDGRVTAAKKIK